MTQPRPTSPWPNPPGVPPVPRHDAEPVTVTFKPCGCGVWAGEPCGCAAFAAEALAADQPRDLTRGRLGPIYQEL